MAAEWIANSARPWARPLRRRSRRDKKSGGKTDAVGAVWRRGSGGASGRDREKDAKKKEK